MEEIAKQPYFKEIAQYHCELAQAALLRADYAQAGASSTCAYATYRGCTRATLVAGDVQAQQGRLAEALAAWQRSSRRIRRSCRSPPIASPTRTARQGTSRKASACFAPIRRNIRRSTCSTRSSRWSLESEGPEAARTLIKDELARNPTLLGLDRLLEAQLVAAPAAQRHDLTLVKELVAQHIKRLGMYKCDNCGFRAKQYYWRCPGCLHWETYSPRRTETPDGYA